MSASQLKEARAKLGITVEEASRRTRIPQRYLDALERGDHALFPPGPFLKGYTQQYRNFLGLPPADAAPPPVPSAPEPSRPPGRADRSAAPLSEEAWLAEGETAEPKPEGREPRGRAGERGADGKARAARPPGLKVSLGGLRLVGVGALSLVVLILAVRLGGVLLPETEPTLGTAPDQIVELRPLERVKVRVIADERLVFEGDLFPKGPDAPPPRVRVCDGDCTFSAHDRIEVAVSNLALVSVVYRGEILKPLGAQGRPRRLVFVDDHNGS